MATAAYLEGRDTGYYGTAPKSANPFRKGWARILTDPRADEWDRGYNWGKLLRIGSLGELAAALANEAVT